MRHWTGRASQEPAVLVLRALGLGDLVTAVPGLRGLRRHFPHHRLALATSPGLAPLVAEMDLADETVPAQGLAGLPVQLEGDDVAVNLHGRGPESTRLLLQTMPEHLIAFAHPDVPATFSFPRWRRHEHERARWCRLLGESGIPAAADDFHLPAPRREAATAGSTVVHPGASAPARQWPPDRWARVAIRLAARGERVVITGGPSEVALAGEIAREARLPPGSVLAGGTDLVELAAVVASARRLLSADTGPAHLAAAFGTPSVTLFGPTSPREWGPPRAPHHQVIWKGGRGAPNAAVPDRGLLQITVEDVLEALDRLPRTPAAQEPSANRAAASRSATS